MKCCYALLGSGCTGGTREENPDPDSLVVRATQVHGAVAAKCAPVSKKREKLAGPPGRFPHPFGVRCRDSVAPYLASPLSRRCPFSGYLLCLAFVVSVCVCVCVCSHFFPSFFPFREWQHRLSVLLSSLICFPPLLPWPSSPSPSLIPSSSSPSSVCVCASVWARLFPFLFCLFVCFALPSSEITKRNPPPQNRNTRGDASPLFSLPPLHHTHTYMDVSSTADRYRAVRPKKRREGLVPSASQRATSVCVRLHVFSTLCVCCVCVCEGGRR